MGNEIRDHSLVLKLSTQNGQVIATAEQFPDWAAQGVSFIAQILDAHNTLNGGTVALQTMAAKRSDDNYDEADLSTQEDRAGTDIVFDGTLTKGQFDGPIGNVAIEGAGMAGAPDVWVQITFLR